MLPIYMQDAAFLDLKDADLCSSMALAGKLRRSVGVEEMVNI